MTDREKVIESLIKALTRVGCGDMDNVALSEVEEAIESAIALLKEQEPVRPRPISYGIYKCGNCGHWLERIIEVDRYCNQCGRKVLWDA